MKRVETSFVCDDCGAPLPNEYIKTGVDEQYFDIHSYNSAHFPVNTDCFIAECLDRLAAIEDILGDEYDLDELRKAMAALRREQE